MTDLQSIKYAPEAVREERGLANVNEALKQMVREGGHDV